LAAFLSSFKTDLNLNDGRFWLTADHYHKHFNDLQSPDRDQVGRVRTASGLASLGLNSRELTDRVFGDVPQMIRAPFVPNLGSLCLRRNALPNCRRSETYDRAVDLSKQDYEQDSLFGLCRHDQSLSHVPLVVGKFKRVHVFDRKQSKHDHIPVNKSVFSVDTQLRVHLYPYGLCAVYVILSLSAPHTFPTGDLIAFLSRLSPTHRASDLLQFSSAFHDGDLSSLFDSASRRLAKAILRNADAPDIWRSPLHAIMCVNVQPKQARSDMTAVRELLGVLSRDANWPAFGYSYTRSYVSFYGKYIGEHSLAASDNLLLSLAQRWRKTSIKRRRRVRSYWGFISIFEKLLAQKDLCSDFFPQVLREAARKVGDSTLVRVGRLGDWLDHMEGQHRKLDPPHRKFYCRAVDAIRFDTTRLEIAKLLDDFKRINRQADLEEDRSSVHAALENLRADIHAEVAQVFDDYGLLARKLDRAENLWNKHRQRIEDTIDKVHEMLQQHLRLSNADIASCEKDLIEQLGKETWDLCHPDAKLFLITAEHLYKVTDNSADFSGAVIEYAKAVEVELHHAVTARLIDYISIHVSKGYIAAGKQRLTPGGQNRLTLGAFPYLFAEHWSSRLTDKKFRNRLYDADFSDFFSSEFRCHYECGTQRRAVATAIQWLADYRNRAAHTRGLRREDVESIRDALRPYGALKVLLAKEFNSSDLGVD